jgi:hypothetical protein
MSPQAANDRASNTVTSNQVERLDFMSFSFREEVEATENLADPGRITTIDGHTVEQLAEDEAWAILASKRV